MNNPTLARRVTMAAVSAALAGGAVLSTAGAASAAAPAAITAASTATTSLPAYTQYPTVATEWRWISFTGSLEQCAYLVAKAKSERGWDATCVKRYQVPGQPNAGHVWDLYYNVP